jgi:hypothetical protein
MLKQAEIVHMVCLSVASEPANISFHANSLKHPITSQVPQMPNKLLKDSWLQP